MGRINIGRHLRGVLRALPFGLGERIRKPVEETTTEQVESAIADMALGEAEKELRRRIGGSIPGKDHIR